MPTYNYRLTGRDIHDLSQVERTDMILNWGPDHIHCGEKDCPFQICAVGGENVMGGAMQEGWGFSPALAAKLKAAYQAAGPGAIGVASNPGEMFGPWRCSLHLTPEHHPITLELIAEKCPAPKHPEYQRGHADGFEEGMKRAALPVRAIPTSGMLDIPTPDELKHVLRSRGGLQALAPVFGSYAASWVNNKSGDEVIDSLADGSGMPKTLVQMIFVSALALASLYFNDKYGDAIEAAVSGQGRVQ